MRLKQGWNDVIWSFGSSTLFIPNMFHQSANVGLFLIACRVRSADKEGHVILLRLNDGHNSLLRVFVGKFLLRNNTIQHAVPPAKPQTQLFPSVLPLVVQASLNAAL